MTETDSDPPYDESDNDSEDGSERRVSTRTPITLRVEYRQMNSFFADYAKNISKGGTFIRTKAPLGIGTEFIFELRFPGREEPITLRGRVVWTTSEEEETAEREAGMGIRFQFVDDQERAALETMVAELMRSALGEKIAAGILRKP